MATVANLTGNNPDEKNNTNNTVGAPASSPQQGATIQPGAAPTQQNQGSGQFTNINKYLKANQNAGQQIGNKIQSGINQDLKGQVSQANNQAQAFQQGVQKAQGNIQQGTTYLGNVGGDINAYNQYLTQAAPTLGPVQADKFDYNRMMGLTANQDELSKFTGLRSGATQQQDKQTLDQASIASQQASQAANDRLNARQQQLASENSRYGLLNEFVGQKNNYNTGNQRLDQLFLQRDKSNTLGNLNQNLNQQRDTTFKGLLDTTKNLQNQSKAAQEQGLNLTKDLTGQTGKNREQEIADLNSQVGTVNQQRASEIQKYRDFVEGLKQGKVTDADLFQKFGLRNGMQTFNVLNDKDLSADQIANLSSQQARDYRDIATQRDVDIYKSLAALAGTDTSALDKAGNLEAAASVKTGSGSLQDRINQARQDFMDRAVAANITGTGSDTYGDWLSGRGTETRTATANIAQLLANAGYLPQQGGQERGSPNAATTGAMLNNVTAAPSLMGSALGLPNVAGILGGIQTSILGDGGKSGAARAAQIQAQADLEAKVNSYLKNAGFGNILTSKGLVDTSQYTDKMRAFDQQNNRALQQLNNQYRNVGLSLESTPEQIKAAAIAATPKSTFDIDAAFANRTTQAVQPVELTPEQLLKAQADTEADMNRQLSAARDTYALRNNQQILLNQLLGVDNPSNTSTNVGAQVEQNKSPIMSYAEAVAAARARGNT